MARSRLTRKYNITTFSKFEKKYKENYKKEEGEALKGNVANHITLGVIQRKQLPDVSDVIELIKLGNSPCDETQAEEILNNWLAIEENKERGLVGAFCDLCKDLCIDIPIHDVIKQQIEKLEDTINTQLIERQDTAKRFKEMLSQLQNLKNVSDNSEKTGVEESNTQE